MAGLNMSDNDLAVQVHFALFRGSGGFVLKPSAMLKKASTTSKSLLRDFTCSERTTGSKRWSRTSKERSLSLRETSSRQSSLSRASPRARPEISLSDDVDAEAFWPLFRERLHRTTIRIISLHQLPKVATVVSPLVPFLIVIQLLSFTEW